ncbi:MAG: hypothetical protein P8L16_04195, partial [Ilumatobacter sp.]|nr:hypothetical protein [Ilumatobacter sp.]
MTGNRTAAVAAAMDDIRRIEANVGVTTKGVEAIRDRIIELSQQRDLFPLEDFPSPTAEDDSNSFLYR